MAAAPSFITRGEIERQAVERREADARAEASREAALGRLADAVRDVRALGLAGDWNVEADRESGEQAGRLTVTIHDIARARRLGALIFGAD